MHRNTLSSYASVFVSLLYLCECIMLGQSVVLVVGCLIAVQAQHQYQQQQPAEIPPHLLRDYLAQQQGHEQSAQTQVIPRPAHIPGAAPSPARYTFVQNEGQYQQPQQYQAQPQPQPQQYRPQPQQYRPQPQQYQAQQKQPEDYDHNPSYQFGFDVNDDQYTNYQNRKEEREGDVIKGSYSVVDSDGFIRTVTYTADPKEGFKAEVSREPTDIVVKVPTPKPQTLQPTQYSQPQQYRPQPVAHAQPQAPAHAQQPQQYYRYDQQ